MNQASPQFGDGMNVAWSKLGHWVDGFFALVPNLVVGGIVLVFFLLAGLLLRWMTHRSFNRRGREDLGEMVADFAFWFTALLGLLLALTIILPTLNPGDLVAGLGIGSVAIGFAFKDILQNWLAGLLILLRQPFRRGDQISMGPIEGTVQRISPRATLIKTYDARVVVVPNTDIYTQSIAIHTAYEHRRISIDITVGYEHDIRDVSRQIVQALTPIQEIMKEPAPQVLPWDLGPTSLGLKIRFWIESRRSSEVSARSRAVQAIKESLQAHDIDPTDPQIIFARLLGAHHERSAAPHRSIATPAPPPPVDSLADDPERDGPIEDKNGTLL